MTTIYDTPTGVQPDAPSHAEHWLKLAGNDLQRAIVLVLREYAYALHDAVRDVPVSDDVPFPGDFDIRIREYRAAFERVLKDLEQRA